MACGGGAEEPAAPADSGGEEAADSGGEETADSDGEVVSITYQLWDANQLPAPEIGRPPRLPPANVAGSRRSAA